MRGKLPYLIFFLLLISGTACWAQSDAPYKGGIGDGYSMTELLVHSSPTAVADELATELKVYPSPLKKGQELVIKHSASGKINSIRLLDLNGNLLLEEKRSSYFTAQNEFVIPTHPFPSGIYFLQLGNQKTTVTKKIIIL